MKLLLLSVVLIAGVLGIPTGGSPPTCVSISYAKFEGPACGVIIFQELSDETVTVSTMGNGICGLDAASGPFPYHIHINQIPSNGDCSAAGGPFDPYNVGDVVCDPNNPGSCQVGDCSGKHGDFEGPTGTCSYSDQYMSLDSSQKGYIGGRSVVIYKSDDTVFACANIIEVSSEEEIPVPDCSDVISPTSTTCGSTRPATDIENPPAETSTSCDTPPIPPTVSSTTPCDTPTPPPTTPCDTSTNPADQDNNASPPGPTSTTTPCDTPTPRPPRHTTDCESSTLPPAQNNDFTTSTTSETTPCDTTSTSTSPCNPPTTAPEEVNQPPPPPPTYSSDSYSTDCDTPATPTLPPGQFNPFPPLTVTTSESTSSNDPPPQQGDANLPTATVTSTGLYFPGSTLLPPPGVGTFTTSSIREAAQTGTNAPLFTGGAGRDGVAKLTLVLIVGVSLLILF